MRAISKKSLLLLAIVSVTVASISLGGLTEYKPLKLTAKEAAVEERHMIGTALTANNVTRDTDSLNSKAEINITEKYVSIVGQSKEKLITLLGENPVSIDEGGLEFRKSGIRVWFKDYGNGRVVSQIFTQNKNIDFNGAKIGDKISNFKRVLGNPIIDKNGEAIFKFKDIFLLINYDTRTEDTVCVYFLKEYNN